MPTSPMLNALLATARITGVAGLTLVAPACKKDGAPPPAPASQPAAVVPDAGADATPAVTEPAAAGDGGTCVRLLKKEGLSELGYDAYMKAMEDPGSAPKLSVEAEACCKQLQQGPDWPRWGCCAAGAVDDQVMACTPWGPPAPPAAMPGLRLS